MNWERLDKQMVTYAEPLSKQVKISVEVVGCLASKLCEETCALSPKQKKEIQDSSPVDLKSRLDELESFEMWMNQTEKQRDPASVRARVIVQNYLCFVYLPEACFSVLAKVAPAGSTLRKCARFLRDNPVRAFRNAISHSNWKYRDDYKALVYWARKGEVPDEPLTQFEVTQEALTFWQALSRCVAYVTYYSLEEVTP